MSIGCFGDFSLKQEFRFLLGIQVSNYGWVGGYVVEAPIP